MKQGVQLDALAADMPCDHIPTGQPCGLSPGTEVAVSQPRVLRRFVVLTPALMLVMAVGALCNDSSQAKPRVDSETTIDVKAGKVPLNLKVGDIDFTFAQIEITPPDKGAVRIKLKVAGSNFSDHDHSVEVRATLVGPSDVQLSTTTKKREIEEGEKDKGLDFEFRVSQEQLASGLTFKLKLTYIP